MGTSTILRSLTGKIFAVALGLAVLSSTADAGMITGVQMFGTEAGTGPGMGTVSVPVILTPNPDNGILAGGGPLDNNITIPVKRFDYPDYIDIVFQVIPTNGVTQYKVVEAVSNNTSSNWSSYIDGVGFWCWSGLYSVSSRRWIGFWRPALCPASRFISFLHCCSNRGSSFVYEWNSASRWFGNLSISH